MINTLYIDGVDMFQEYGVFVHNGGYSGLVSYPPLKSVEFNDWPEDDGIDPDLSDTKLDTKSFSMMFAGTNAPLSESFINFLSDGAYHDFDFQQIGITRKLRLLSQPSKKTVHTLEVFNLQFADDFPLDGYEYLEPLPVPSVWQRGYHLDERDLSEYGVWITDGTDDEIMKSPSVKQNLLINTPSINGAVYDGENVVFQAKDATLKCHIRADVETFWRNYNALLFDLSKPGQRVFYFDKRGEELLCYYKSSTVSNFSASSDEIWCDFTLTLSFFSFRVEGIDYLLAAENGDLIITEDEEFYIDVQNYGH